MVRNFERFKNRSNSKNALKFASHLKLLFTTHIMKTFKQRLTSVLTISLISIFGFYCKADGQSNGSSQISIYILGSNSSNNHLRPQVPSRQRIDCFYENGYLHFNFTIPEGECLLTLINAETGESSQYNFNSNYPSVIYIGYIDNAEIIIDTDNGNTYQGFIN